MTAHRAATVLAAVALGIGLGTGPLAGCAPAPPPARGAVPIPTPSPVTPVTASPGRPALVAMGDPVAAGPAVVTAHGPDLPTPPQGAPPPDTAPGTITVSASGPADLSAGAFVLRDEEGKPVAVTATPAGSGAVRLAATMSTGQAVLTWQPNGAPLASWDFQVELD